MRSPGLFFAVLRRFRRNERIVEDYAKGGALGRTSLVLGVTGRYSKSRCKTQFLLMQSGNGFLVERQLHRGKRRKECKVDLHAFILTAHVKWSFNAKAVSEFLPLMWPEISACASVIARLIAIAQLPR